MKFGKHITHALAYIGAVMKPLGIAGVNFLIKKYCPCNHNSDTTQIIGPIGENTSMLQDHA